MMCSYIKIMMMFGNACEHMLSVTTTYFLIQERIATFQELMNKTQVAHLVWAIFVDARAAPQPKSCITVMSLKRAGCFGYLFFGKRSNNQCSFKYDGEIDEAKSDGVIEKMRPGLAKFMELNS